jgi:hypothetical protein
MRMLPTEATPDPQLGILFSSHFTSYNKHTKIFIPITHQLSNLSPINCVSIFRCHSPPRNPMGILVRKDFQCM